LSGHGSRVVVELGHIFTIGHSTHEIGHFLSLLRQHDVTALADVRSTPASRFTPQFGRDALKRALDDGGVKYVFLGRELGARSDNPHCYVNGQVQFGLLAQTPEFAEGVERLLKGMKTERIAVMCAEQEPLDCHRTVLVAPVMVDRGVAVDHIHGDGHLESHADAMLRLMSGFGLGEADLFHTANELMAEALSRQERRIAYVVKDRQANPGQSR
jgi:uncharacterized protein (DUF488 family)